MRVFSRGAAPVLGLLTFATLAVASISDKPGKAPDVSVAVSFPEEADTSLSARMAGSSLFMSYCASCHGATAEGDGPLADQLRFRPSDLTLLAHHDGGTFDKEKVRRIIDGRNPVKGHGGPDMPAWHDAFKAAIDGYSEERVSQRIQILVDYLAAVQRKP